jgi:hypothetical protein
MWRLWVHPEVRFDNNAISLVLDQLVVVHAGHSRRVARAARIVRAEELKSASRLVLREEQSSSLVDVDDLPGLDAIRPRDIHGPPRVLLTVRSRMARRRQDVDYQF